MVWLGIDLGDARVGLALSDRAHPRTSIGNIQVYGDSFRALDEVIDVIGDESVDHVVIGLPLLLNGEEGKSAKKRDAGPSILKNDCMRPWRMNHIR